MTDLGYDQSQIDLSSATDAEMDIPLPSGLELWGFQRANVRYALEPGRDHVLIADQPGLGKTNSAIAICNVRHARRVLVVCPAAVRIQWARRIQEWSTMPWPYKIHLVKGGKMGISPDAEWLIISYDMCVSTKIHAALMKLNWEAIILDEAHYVKNISAKRTKAVLGNLHEPGLISRATHVIALTGTPLPNRPREIYPITRALCWDAIDWMGQTAFEEYYNPIETVRIRKPRVTRNGETVYESRIVGQSEQQLHCEELQKRLRAGFMTRHAKSDVMTQLKRPQFDIIRLNETGPVKAALKAESLLGIDPESFQGSNRQFDGQIATVRKMMGLALAPQVVEYIKELVLGGEEKLVVFGWHVEVLDIFEAGWAKTGAVRIDGSVSGAQRDKRIYRFVHDPDVKIIFGNLLAMGTGVDGLQEVCCHVLIAEPDWVPGVNIQAFDRLDRGGQTRQVQGDIFVAPESLAEKILSCALKKLRTITKCLDTTPEPLY